MAKILVVDDEMDLQDLIRQKYRKKIKNKEYEFVFALNGVDALLKINEEQDIDIILSDINMPEMDGLTLLSKLNETSPLIKSVIVSAYGDMENIRTAMNRGAFDFITKPIDFDDLTITIEKTLDHVRQIKNTFKAIKENNILKMYVDETVINFMGSREYEASILANETIEASVMFIDICGFTSISESAPPDDVIKLLNNYFDIMVKRIIENEGYVDKFIGDAIMAVFRDSDYLDRAIKTALLVRKDIETLPVFGDTISFKPMVSIGINSGEMISGNIGSESLKRLDFTVIGDAVNMAQRLQSIAKKNQIVISETGYSQVKDSFKCEALGEVQMKNKAELTAIFEVLG
ncbi:MAG: adenylate/guanylate cyclase domain-containing protein [Saprospiraceae bacterium]